MDLINWSLNEIDTIFSMRSLGSGEPDCPAGTFAAGYSMDAWEKWRVVCLAALSVEDIEDIYLFGTLITGFLLIGLGGTLVYRKMYETVTAVKSPLRLPDMIEALGRAVGTQTVAIHAIWITSWQLLTAIWITTRRSSRLCKGNWSNSETGRNRSRRANWRTAQTTPILSAFGPLNQHCLGQGCCWNNNSPEDRCSETLLHSLPPFHRHLWIVVSVQDLFKDVSMATTILRTENLSD